MGIISIAAQLILSLSILVVLHECGHFFPAKWFKTRVEKFYLFFNPGFSLFKKQIGETEYGIGWIPFGGYVKISGMIDESMDTEQMAQEPQPWEFRSKPAWQRLIIMLGGVTVNFILGILIFAGILWYFGINYLENEKAIHGIVPTEIGIGMGMHEGDKIISVGEIPFDRFRPGSVSQEIILNDPGYVMVSRDGAEKKLIVPENMPETLTKNKGVGLFDLKWPQEIAEVDKEGAAEKAGLQAGDRIIKVDTFITTQLVDFSDAMKGRKNQDVNLEVIRGLDTLKIVASLGKSGNLGIKNIIPERQREKFSLGQAIPKGAKMSYTFLTDQLKAFGKIGEGKIKMKDSLGSVLSIANMFSPDWDWEIFWRITAMLSILLGFFNLLPIPALDGGYVMFLIWEVVTGRKPNDKFMEYATITGFFILIALMIFALGNDIRNMF